MLNEKQIRVCQLYVQGYGVTDISKKTGVSRTTIYEWIKKEDFKECIEKMTNELVVEANRHLKSNIQSYIDVITEIALNGSSEANRLKASVYLVNRVLGNTSVNISQEVIDKTKDKEITWEDLDKIDGVTKFVV